VSTSNGAGTRFTTVNRRSSGLDTRTAKTGVIHTYRGTYLVLLRVLERTAAVKIDKYDTSEVGDSRVEVCSKNEMREKDRAL
jgi:hypothetical protein